MEPNSRDAVPSALTEPTRRGFLATGGALLLGRFLPAELLAAAAPATPVDLGPEGDLIRRLVGGPVWVEHLGGRQCVWAETVAGEIEIMGWKPETEEEHAEVNRFYEAAMWKSWRTPEDLHRVLSEPGPWLARYTMNPFGNFIFLTTTDENVLFDPAQKRIFTNNPAEAAEMTSQQALAVILRFTQEWELDGNIYFEPVRRERAMVDLRLERLAVLLDQK